MVKIHFFLKIRVVTEEMIYTYADLIADFGGYLGLLLGASIMSMYDIIAQIGVNIKQQFINRKKQGYNNKC